jgi:hypothetical protein
MNAEQYHFEGFVKRAAECGFDAPQAIEMYKTAGKTDRLYFGSARHLRGKAREKYIRDFDKAMERSGWTKKQKAENKMVAAGALGLTAGGIGGALLSRKSEKKAFLDEDGPYRTEAAARMMGDEALLKAIEHSKKDHKLQYYLNPFVAGPLTEMAARYRRRVNAAHASRNGALMRFLAGDIPNAINGDEETRAKAREAYDRLLRANTPENML